MGGHGPGGQQRPLDGLVQRGGHLDGHRPDRGAGGRPPHAGAVLHGGGRRGGQHLPAGPRRA